MEDSVMSSSPPQAKRPRLGSQIKSKEDESSSSFHGKHSEFPSLTPELWAKVMEEFLMFTDLQRCCAVSKLFLREVMPQVKTIWVDSPKAMRAIYARRFPNVSGVKICCLFRYDARLPYDELDVVLCNKTLSRMVPFASTFSDVTIVLAGKTIYGNGDHFSDLFDVLLCEPVLLKKKLSVSLGKLVESICGAYSVGTLSVDVTFHKILDLHICYGRGRKASKQNCFQCQQVCTSFPVENVFDSLIGARETVVNANSMEKN